MRSKLLITLMLVTVIGAFRAQAQQEYMITQYMYNGLALNPAYAGIHDGVSVGALWREQWTAIDGAPNTQLLSIHSPLNYRYASLGAVLYRDVLGVKTEYTGYFSYSYRIRVGENSELSMGLQMNLHNFSNDISRLENQRGLLQNTNISDPLYQEFVDDNLGFKWNFGAGLMLHSDRYYVGVSVPQLLNKKYFENLPDDVESSRLVRHLFVSAGYVLNTDSDVVLKPNVLFKAVQNAPIEFDINLNALLSKVLWLGVSLRSELSQATEKKAGPLESISGLIALQINPQMQLGYAYDFTTTAINTNSHEIMLNYIFNLPTNKILTPRYF
ncbi:MAG: type IX secretion system membrane protein PorP/SprF [Bacteroidota bacterium]